MDIYDNFELASLGTLSVFEALPYHPLKLVAAPDNAPRLVVQYDHHAGGRVIREAPRVGADCTHVNVTIMAGTGEAPVCAGFGAASRLMTLKEGCFRFVNPDMEEEDKRIFGRLASKPGFMKLLDPALTSLVKGQVIEESWRICDSFMSVALKTDKQIQGALDIVTKWMRDPPKYEVRSLRGVNCKDFVGAVIEGAGVHKPLGWDIKPWPGVDVTALEIFCQHKSKQFGDWLLQPRAITKQMEQRALNTPKENGPSRLSAVREWRLGRQRQAEMPAFA